MIYKNKLFVFSFCFVFLTLFIISCESKKSISNNSGNVDDSSIVVEEISFKDWEQILLLVIKEYDIKLSSDKVAVLFQKLDSLIKQDENEFWSVDLDNKYFLIIEENVLHLNIVDLEDKSLVISPTPKKNIFATKIVNEKSLKILFYTFNKEKNSLSIVPNNTIIQEYSIDDFVTTNLPKDIYDSI